MIAVVIIGVLAAVTVPAYLEYVQKSRASEGALAIRFFYDAEHVFASKNQMFVNDSTHGQVPCRPSPRFVSICTKSLDGSTIRDYPPSIKRPFVIYHDNNYFTYNPSTRVCTMDNYYGHPKLLNLGGNGPTRFRGTEYYTTFPTPTFFLVRARQDQALVDEYGASLPNTLMITAIADLDGDNDDDGVWCEGGGVGLSPSESYFDIKNLHIYARGMYIDVLGEVKGTGMIVVNEND
ncbi:hypothetical protein MRY82_05130 [bacterium]|nr:hypothetical protein [bacterium]